MQFHPTGLPHTGILITEAVRGEEGLPAQQGRRALPGALRPHPDGARPPGHHLPRHHHRVRGRAGLRRPLRQLRPPGRPAPGGAHHRREAPLRPRAGAQLHRDRPGHGGHPGAPRGALHDGGCIRTRTAPLPWPGSTRPGSAPTSASTAPTAWAPTPSPSASSSAPGPGAPPATRWSNPPRRRIRCSSSPRRGAAGRAGVSPGPGRARRERRGGERVATIREALQETMERGAGVFRTGDGLRTAVGELGALRERWAAAAGRPQPALQHRAVLRPGAGVHGGRGRGRRRVRPRAKESRAPTPGGTSRSATTTAFWPTPWPTASRGRARLEYLPVRITRWEPQARTY